MTDFKENAGIAATFTEMGRLLELSADQPARVRAFLRVADILLTSAESVGVLAREGRLRALPGISAAAERIILEWLENGCVETPHDMAVILGKISWFGPLACAGIKPL